MLCVFNAQILALTGHFECWIIYPEQTINWHGTFIYENIDILCKHDQSAKQNICVFVVRTVKRFVSPSMSGGRRNEMCS